jgi:uncharacterized protein DUF998
VTTTLVARRGAAVALGGVAALAAGTFLILLLHVVGPTERISATRRTISEYGIGESKWVFDLAVLLVVAGSVAGFGALWWQRRLPVPAAAFGALWTVGLLVIVAFPKHDWALAGPAGPGPTLHRAASVVAFVCLPLAVLVAARAAFPDAPVRRLAAQVLALGSLAWFGVILAAVVRAAGGPWWQLIPLGVVERGMALTELLALAVLVLPRRAQPSCLST